MMEKRLKALPFILLGFWTVYLIAGFSTPTPPTAMDAAGFARLPVLSGGRLKPLDTVARTSLLILRGKQTVPGPSRTLNADEWLLDMLYNSKEADRDAVFSIDDPDILGVMGMTQTANRYYSFSDLRPHLKEIENQAGQTEEVKADKRSRYQSAISNLQDRVVLYQKLQNTLQLAGSGQMLEEARVFNEKIGPLLMTVMARGKASPSKEILPMVQIAQRYDFLRRVAEFYPIPGARGLSKLEWISMGQGILDSMASARLPPAVEAYASLGDAYRASDAAGFKKALIEYENWLDAKAPEAYAHAQNEFLFNRYEPFYKSMTIYLAVFLLAVLSFLGARRPLLQGAFYLLILAFAVHTVGLGTRMALQGRPPVTNLYSSAIFVGWAAVLLGIVLERLYRNGIGSMAASMIGFTTLIIAHHLAAQGDTLEMMRAVLDSNFWLATHVVCITIGYSSTFLAGFLGVLYVVRSSIDPGWTKTSAAELERMVYGVVCFSLLFSFIGTILGGIWADQSWGRFWGWDPKENGALMIVLWNSFILHARLGNLAKPKDFVLMAVFGNMVTAFSWFGVNMLGIGLHSYGWMDKAFFWLAAFAASQALVIAVGLGSWKLKSSPRP